MIRAGRPAGRLKSKSWIADLGSQEKHAGQPARRCWKSKEGSERCAARAQIEREISCSVGTRPAGVSLSTASGKYWLRLASRSSRDNPECAVSALI